MKLFRDNTTKYGGALDDIWARFASKEFATLPLPDKLWETREAAQAILAILPPDRVAVIESPTTA